MARLTKRRGFIVLSLAIAVAGGGWAFYSWMFPYGQSHSCDKMLAFALVQYAEEHGGVYPSGEASPEASLSLLYPKYVSAEIIRGKTVPIDVVQAVLDRGERLGPNSCGWHYVAGLTKDDNPRMALCWEKVGLGHFGQRSFDGGRSVIFVNSSFVEHIPGSKWEEFLAEQKKLHEVRAAKKGK